MSEQQAWHHGWPVMKGGPGSGHHSHAGRPGEHGGSRPGVPGGVGVAYERRLSGAIVIGIEAALKAAPRYRGIQFRNTNPTYGEEIPDKVRDFITESIIKRYAPLGWETLDAKERGDPGWRDIRRRAFDVLNSIADEAETMWKQ